MNSIDIKIYDETVLTRLYELEENYKTGIKSHFHAYVHYKFPDAVVLNEKNEVIRVQDGLINEDFINQYLIKDPRLDFGAKDCAFMAIDHVGIPPEEEMSVESIEKLIRDIMSNDYADKAYGKHVKGKKNVLCVDLKTAMEITSSPKVMEYVHKQIEKAEKREIHKDPVAWKAYELQKKKIEWIESLSSTELDSDCYSPYCLSEEAKRNLIAKAVFNMLYTDFDFDKYESYKEEMSALDADWDFGKRYQELDEIFSSPDYKGEFYIIKSENAFLDVLADKIAEKIIEKTSGIGSEE
ncbi:MAG: hypothetical protein IKP88_20230 [Lachnospiraceae bacterium]|nr:hypothetical protein [Lachnospiraceae bacterium]